MAINLDWENLGFSYRNLPFRYIARFKDGKWSAGELTGDNQLHISESSPALHYGQQGFEGLKAYRTKDGSIQLFVQTKMLLVCKKRLAVFVWQKFQLKCLLTQLNK